MIKINALFRLNLLLSAEAITFFIYLTKWGLLMCEKIHHRNHFHIKLQRQSYSTEQIVPKWSFMSSSEDSGASKMENNTIIPSTFLESFSLNFYFPAITLCIKNLPWTLHIHCYNNYANLARETFGFIADLIKRNFFRMLDINLFFCMRSRRDGLFFWVQLGATFPGSQVKEDRHWRSQWYAITRQPRGYVQPRSKLYLQSVRGFSCTLFSGFQFCLYI